MPFLLEATKNDEAMMLSCQLPLYNQICPQPKTGTKRQHLDTTEESTQLPEGKRHAGLSPIPMMNDEGDVGVREIVVTSATGLEVGPDGAILNHQPILTPTNLQSPTMPNYNLLVVPDTNEIWPKREEEFFVKSEHGHKGRRCAIATSTADAGPSRPPQPEREGCSGDG